MYYDNSSISPVVFSYNVQTKTFEPFNGSPELNTGVSWCAAQAELGNFLQFDLKRSFLVYGLIIQSHHKKDRWMTSFKMSYSTDGFLWRHYKTSSSAKVHTTDYTVLPRLSVSRLIVPRLSGRSSAQKLLLSTLI